MCFVILGTILYSSWLAVNFSIAFLPGDGQIPSIRWAVFTNNDGRSPPAMNKDSIFSSSNVERPFLFSPTQMKIRLGGFAFFFYNRFP